MALWNRTVDHVAEISAVQGIEVEGVVNGFGGLKLVTSDMGEALAEADLMMVCVTCFRPS